jgi:hypothetical protein
MNRFKQNPLKNLYHVQAVEPPKTGRAKRRANKQPTPPSPRRGSPTLEQSFSRALRNLQSTAYDLAGGPDRTSVALYDLDSMSSHPAVIAERAEAERQLYEDVRAIARQFRIPSHMLRSAHADFSPLERRIAAHQLEDELLYGTRDAARPSRSLSAADLIISTPRRPNAHMLTATETLRRREEGRAQLRQHTFNIDVDSINIESLRAAFAETRPESARSVEAIQRAGRIMRDSVNRESTRNYPIQSAAAEMMAADMRGTLARSLEQAMTQPLRREEIQVALGDFARSPINAESVNGFIDRFMNRAANVKAEVKKPPHPDAGKVINRPRRSVAGIMVEDVRNADGSVSRRPRTTDPK